MDRQFRFKLKQLYIASDDVSLANVLIDSEIVSARISGVHLYSCYVSPNQPVEASTYFLQRLDDSIRTISRF